MREIKFRAWHIAARRMYYSTTVDMGYQNNETDGSYYMPVAFQLGTIPRTRVVEHRDDGDEIEDLLRLMQYTGLKDKNGVEIYEGDIIKYQFSPNSSAVTKVYYQQEECRFAADDGGDKGWALYDDSDLEVIGDVYKNPELLKETTS